MPKGSRKRPKREDEAQAAVRIVATLIERTEDADADVALEVTAEMRAAAAAFGRVGGLKGGPARAAKLSPEERSKIAARAAVARWSHRDKSS